MSVKKLITRIIGVFLGLLILVALLTSISSATPVYYSGNGHYYDRVYVPITWNDAKTAAESLSYNGVNGHLATITSQDEEDFILNNCGLSFVWLGGFQLPNSPEPAGGWQWVTGEPWGYTCWYTRLNDPYSQPNNYYYRELCGDQPIGSPENALNIGDGRWFDFPADCIGEGYIVEYDEKMIWPVPGYQLVSCVFKTYYGGYHERLNPVNQNTKNEPKKFKLRPHEGIDIPALENTRVIAAAGGKVIFSGMKGENGNLIQIQHPNGYITSYAHLKSRSVIAGDTVKQGDTVGFVGNTGKGTGNHLHFAVKNENGDFVDPLDFYDDSKLTLPIAVYSQDEGTVESVSYGSIKDSGAHQTGLIVIKDINGEMKYYSLLNDIYDINVGYEVYPGKLIADKF